MATYPTIRNLPRPPDGEPTTEMSAGVGLRAGLGFQWLQLVLPRRGSLGRSIGRTALAVDGRWPLTVGGGWLGLRALTVETLWGFVGRFAEWRVAGRGTVDGRGAEAPEGHRCAAGRHRPGCRKPDRRKRGWPGLGHHGPRRPGPGRHTPGHRKHGRHTGHRRPDRAVLRGAGRRPTAPAGLGPRAAPARSGQLRRPRHMAGHRPAAQPTPRRLVARKRPALGKRAGRKPRVRERPVGRKRRVREKPVGRKRSVPGKRVARMWRARLRRRHPVGPATHCRLRAPGHRRPDRGPGAAGVASCGGWLTRPGTRTAARA